MKMCQSYKFILELDIRETNVFIKFSLPTRKTNGICSRHRLFRSQRDSSYKFNANAFLSKGVKYQGGRIRKIYEDCVFCHHEISQLSSRESRESRKRRVASPALVGIAADANERRLRRLPVYRHQGVLLAALSTGW